MDYTEYKIGDLVRRYQVGDPEQMFVFDKKNLGVVTEVTTGSRAEVRVYWQLSERVSYYSLYAAQKLLELIKKGVYKPNQNIKKEI